MKSEIKNKFSNNLKLYVYNLNLIYNLIISLYDLYL